MTWFTHSSPLTRNTLARASIVNSIFTAVASSFARLMDSDLFRDRRMFYAADTGAVNAYVVTFDPVPLAYVTGMTIDLVAANTNTGASTINVNGLGAKNVLDADGAAVVAGAIVANRVTTLKYDGSSFRTLATVTTTTPGDGTVTGAKLSYPFTTTGVFNATGGAFTSIGIDDNATGERLQIGNTSMQFGVAGADYEIEHVADDRVFTISGGSGASAGNIVLRGGAAGGNVTLSANGTQFLTSGGASVTAALAWTFGSTVTATSFSGSGASLTALDATNLASGTVASARVSGSYTGITGTGALNAGSITSGFGSINIGASTFTTTGDVTAGNNYRMGSVGTQSRLRYTVSGVATRFALRDDTLGADVLSFDTNGAAAFAFGLSGTTGTFSSTLGVTGTLTANGALNVVGAATFNDPVTATETLSVGTTLSVTGATTLAALSATTGTFSGAVSTTTLTASANVDCVGSFRGTAAGGDTVLENLSSGNNTIVACFGGGSIRLRPSGSGSATNEGIYTSDGFLLLGKSAFGNTAGIGLDKAGFVQLTRSGANLLDINRLTSDGVLVNFEQDSVNEGSISVASNTVSYNAFFGSHWSQLSDGSRPEILRGTIIETIDEMCEWLWLSYTDHEGNEQLNERAVPLGAKVGDVVDFTYEYERGWEREVEKVTVDEIEVPETVLVDEVVERVEVVGDKARLIKQQRQVEKQVFDEFPMVHANGKPVRMKVGGELVNRIYRVPRMKVERRERREAFVETGVERILVTVTATAVPQKEKRLPRFKISDTAGSKSVYGVFAWWDDDWTATNDAHIGAIGAYLIRIAPGVTVQRGDYIESNGDGCGRVQADDILRASTVAKVTSPTVAEVYPDGSYTVPCTLHCG
jgi:hypothetical protein